MINQKIDRVLFNIVQTLEDGKRSECIIKAYDYKRLKILQKKGKDALEMNIYS